MEAQTEMPKELKESMREYLINRCKELGTPEFFEMIATEGYAITPEELIEHCQRVNHLALKMPPLL